MADPLLNLDDLAKDHRLLRICNRGTGWSDPVEQPFTVSDMVADAIAVALCHLHSLKRSAT